MHEGHRQRMFERLESGSKIEDHELLEMLLFYALPRINTNEISHTLIDSFGNLPSVFNADVKMLEEVKGVGPGSARFLRLLGLVMERIINSSRSTKPPHAYSYETFTQFIQDRYRYETEEVAEIFAVKKNGELVFGRKFTSEDRFMVELPISELTSLVATFNPKAVILVHNHVEGSSRPSAQDDYITKMFFLYLNMNNVNLLDHFIVSRNSIYSYDREKRMDEIRREYTAEKLLRK